MLTTLGRTGLSASRIGLGLAALGRPGYINLGHSSDLAGQTDVESLERVAHAVLDAAYNRGVRYFDVARSYGKGEAFLGEWLRGRRLGPSEVTVASKWGYTYTAGWRVDAPINEVKDLSLGALRRQFAESRDLWPEPPPLPNPLRHPRQRGPGGPRSARRAGAATSRRAGDRAHSDWPRQAETVERALEVGGFDTVQATWNLLERTAGPVLATAHAAGMGVIVKEPLANGRLTSRGSVAALSDVAREAATTADAVALAAVLAQPWADVVLSGAATTDELESNLDALELDLGPAYFRAARRGTRGQRDLLADASRAPLELSRSRRGALYGEQPCCHVPWCENTDVETGRANG